MIKARLAIQLTIMHGVIFLIIRKVVFLKMELIVLIFIRDIVFLLMDIIVMINLN